MFSKTNDPTSAPPPRGNSNARSVLASDLRITGEISSTGHIEILGEVDGNVSARGVVLGAEGRLSGQISAEVVEVKGKLDGKVTSSEFSLRASAQVAADITYKTLVVDSGAQIEGRFTLARD
jgi:cytoskeletal protein CcmA (bactofilin family)